MEWCVGFFPLLNLMTAFSLSAKAHYNFVPNKGDPISSSYSHQSPIMMTWHLSRSKGQKMPYLLPYSSVQNGANATQYVLEASVTIEFSHEWGHMQGWAEHRACSNTRSLGSYFGVLGELDTRTLQFEHARARSILDPGCSRASRFNSRP